MQQIFFLILVDRLIRTYKYEISAHMVNKTGVKES